MQQSKFAKITNNILCCVGLIVVFTMLLGSALKNIFTQLVLGTVLGIATYITLQKIIFNKTAQKQLKANELKHCEKIYQTLKYTSPTQIYSLFTAILKEHFTVIEAKPYLKATSKTHKTTYSLTFNFYDPTLNLTEYFNILERCPEQNSPLIIFANDFSQDVISANKNNALVVLINKTEGYKFFKHFNAFPKTLPEATKNSFKQNLLNCFSKANSKKFFAISIFLGLFSLFTFYKLYYRITALIFFFTAICCYFCKNINQTQSAQGFNKCIEILENK